MSSLDTSLIGAHTSIAGGLHHAIEDAASIGATTTQIFTANQRQWSPKSPTVADAELFREVRHMRGIEKVMSHASYLLNLGSPHDEGLYRSREAFRVEIERCRMLEVSFLNFHPGAALQGSREACLDRIVESILLMGDLLTDGRLTLVIEMTAGQGSVVGCNFDEIAYLIRGTSGKIPVGVCVDTCHLFAAGYDIRTSKGWDTTLGLFDQEIGWEFLTAFHLNDSMHPLGSRKDRHAPLGKGEIGADSFVYLMKNVRTVQVPKYLETPGGLALWEEEIQWLRSYAV